MTNATEEKRAKDSDRPSKPTVIAKGTGCALTWPAGTNAVEEMWFETFEDLKKWVSDVSSAVSRFEP
jgi:hypothetical protein